MNNESWLLMASALELLYAAHMPYQILSQYESFLGLFVTWFFSQIQRDLVIFSRIRLCCFSSSPPLWYPMFYSSAGVGSVSRATCYCWLHNYIVINIMVMVSKLKTILSTLPDCLIKETLNPFRVH